MKISKKYKPLFDIPEARNNSGPYWDQLKEVDTIIITGGRDSAKSFTTALALANMAANYNHRILYTRYTLTSAKDSIIPDFKEKIELLNYGDFFHVTQDRITGKHNDSKIVFKGVKTSSGNQTASLKSLKDFSCFVCEEAEEFPNFDDWEKIQLSIRATDVQALNILILNPASKKHWIYQNFFLDKGVKEGFNGINENILYIHTDYTDVPKEFIAPKNLRKYKRARAIYEKLEKLSKEERKQQPKKDFKQWSYYKYVVLGGWLQQADGVIFDDWNKYSEEPKEYDLKIYGLDFGFAQDPAAFCECTIVGDDVYIKEHIYKTGLLNDDLAAIIKNVITDEESYIVADSANPKDIADLNAKGLYVIPCKKGPDSIKNGLNKMKEKNIFIHRDSINLIDELNNYRSIEVVNAKGEVKQHIVQSNDHLIDAARYAITRYL